jgi:hypothetical protein
MRAD